MSLIVYLDSSGKAKDKSSIVATLAAVALDEAEVPEFEDMWLKSVLHSGKKPISRLHMSDLFAGEGEFREWSPGERFDLYKSAIDVMGQFTYRGLHAAACTVVLEDHAACRREYKALKSAPSLSVDFCLSVIGVGRDGYLKAYFDENEEYRHKIDRVWRREKRLPGWPSQIRLIESCRSTGAPLLQVADMVAWFERRKQLGKLGRLEFQHFLTLLTTACKWRLYDRRMLARMASSGRCLRPQQCVPVCDC